MVVAVSLAATVTPAEAQTQQTFSQIMASSEVPSNVKASSWGTVNTWLQSPHTSGSNGPGWATSNPSLSGRPGTLSAWTKARVALGGLGGSQALPALTLSAGALWLGWEIGHASGASDWVRGYLLGIGSPQLVLSITGQTWTPTGTDTSTGWDPEIPRTFFGGLTNAYRLQMTGSTGGCPSARHHFGTNVNALYSGCNATNDQGMMDAIQGVAATLAVPAGQAQLFTCVADGVGGNTCDGGQTVSYQELWWSPGGTTANALLNGLTVTQAGAYSASDHAAFKTHTFTSQPREGSVGHESATATAAIAAIATDPALDLEIGRILLPSTSGDPTTELRTLLQPKLGETAAAYRTRLRNQGFLGTITISESPDPVEDFGPSAVIAVEYTPQGTTTVTQLHMLDPWPDPSPRLDQETEITIYSNPSDAPAPPAGPPPPGYDPIPPGPGGGGEGGPIDWCPRCPPVDFSRLTSVDFGEHFPFGVFTWLGGVFGNLAGQEPRCPDFALDRPAGLGGGTLDVSFCNEEWETTYRPWVFAAIKFLMTLAAVAFVALRIVGIGKGE